MTKVNRFVAIIFIGMVVASMAAGCGSNTKASDASTGPGQTLDRPQRGGMENVLTASVSAGIISQETADKITEFQKKQMQDQTAEREKVQNMSDEERKAYFEKRGGTDPVAEWLKAGLITQDQADKIKKIMPQGHNSNVGGKTGN